MRNYRHPQERGDGAMVHLGKQYTISDGIVLGVEDDVVMPNGFLEVPLGDVQFADAAEEATYTNESSSDAEEAEFDETPDAPEVEDPPKRKRGRPPKNR